jgi:GxxExxY protein
MSTAQELNTLTDAIIGAAIQVHKEVGPGLLESAYQHCLQYLLANAGLQVEAEHPVPLKFRGLQLETAYRLDLLVESKVIVEVKAIERFAPIHIAQMLTYLRLTGCKVGLLINFNVPVLVHGVKRVILNFPEN